MQSGDLGSLRRDTAIVFLSHRWDEAIGQRFARLRREASPLADCFVLLQDDGGEVTLKARAFLETIGASDALVTFNDFELDRQLGLRYFGMQRVMANTHFPLLSFARTHRYAYYWQVEFDVEYRGNWRSFFEPYGATDAALLGAHFHRITDWPEWYWWPSLCLPSGMRLEAHQLFKAFMALARFSRAALETIEQAHRDGWMGHFEAVAPTSLMLAGHRLEDLNVRNTCYAGAFQDPCALLSLQSTLRCRPYVSLHEFCNRGQGPLIFHPVKESWTFDGEKVVVTGAPPP